MPTPILTYYSYDSGDPAAKYGLQLVYNPVLNEIWTHFNFLNPANNDDYLVRVANADGGGFSIGDIIDQSVIIMSPGFTRDGFPDFYDSYRNLIVFRSSSGGEKIQTLNPTTAAVTPHATNNYSTWAYNTYATGTARPYGLRSSSIQWDTLDVSTGTGTSAISVLPPGESFFSNSLTFSDATTGWMMRQFVASNKLDSYDLTTGLISGTFVLPGAVTTGQWVTYCPVNNSIYITAETTDSSALRWLERYDIGTNTFTTVWTTTNPLSPRWFNSTDSAPILNYDPYRNWIWFNDGNGLLNVDSIVAFDCATDTQAYKFGPPVFGADSTFPWKYAIAPDSVWVSENNIASFNQLLRISFPSVPVEQPRIWVTLPKRIPT